MVGVRVRNARSAERGGMKAASADRCLETHCALGSESAVGRERKAVGRGVGGAMMNNATIGVGGTDAK